MGSKKHKKQKLYEIDPDKIKTFEDFKVILKYMGLIFEPENKEALKSLKPYIKGEIKTK